MALFGVYPGGVADSSRGLSEATPPGVGIMRLHPERVPEGLRTTHDNLRNSSFPWVIFFEATLQISGTPSGCKTIHYVSGGVAALNLRLLSLTPPGYEKQCHAIFRFPPAFRAVGQEF